MALVADRYVVANSLSEAWLDAVRCVYNIPGSKAVHLLVRILEPTSEINEIRDAAQDLIDGWNASHQREFYGITTTRNTLFPAAWARRHPEPEDLAEYYRSRYNRDHLRAFRDNARGTYFGRIVAYPRGDDEPADQLTETIRKLRDELATRAPKSSRYEINIFSEALDTNPMSFPCLAHLSVHLHKRRLHVQAIYRNETLVGRAYGNYLGIAELQAYMATTIGVAVGELLITAGHVELDGSRVAVRAMLDRFAAPIHTP
jgi:thymidylate synthase